jgi:hypothetical protein
MPKKTQKGVKTPASDYYGVMKWDCFIQASG